MITEFSTSILHAADAARGANANSETAREALDCMDATSLKGTETEAEIRALCEQAREAGTASVCVYPSCVAQARGFFPDSGSQRVATVISFPAGHFRTLTETRASPDSVREDVREAIESGANQIDIVFAHEDFRAGERAYAQSLLRACREACGDQAKMLVILETASFDREDNLREACNLALGCGADGLKTSTGMHPAGGAQLETAAILLDEAAHAGRSVLVKVSGGVRSPEDCARYLGLARRYKGEARMIPERFRIGASRVVPLLVRAAENSNCGLSGTRMDYAL